MVDEAVVKRAINILKNVDGIGYMEVNSSYVVRHSLVKDIIKAYAKNEEEKDAG